MRGKAAGHRGLLARSEARFGAIIGSGCGRARGLTLRVRLADRAPRTRFRPARGVRSERDSRPRQGCRYRNNCDDPGTLASRKGGSCELRRAGPVSLPWHAGRLLGCQESASLRGDPVENRAQGGVTLGQGLSGCFIAGHVMTMALSGARSMCVGWKPLPRQRESPEQPCLIAAPFLNIAISTNLCSLPRGCRAKRVAESTTEVCSR